MISVLVITAELITFFQRGTELRTAIQHYSNSMRQSDTTHYMLITLFHLSKSQGDPDTAAKKAVLETILEKLQTAKNSLSESHKYLSVMDQSSTVLSVSGLDTRAYRISEIFEQILGKVIKLKDTIGTHAFSQSFKFSSDNFYYVTMNSMATLLPRLASVQSVMHDHMVSTANDNVVTMAVVGSLLFLVAVTIASTLVFMKQSLRLKMKLMEPFVLIPENTVKLYHAQSEYYVLLFSGMEDKHVDDLKTEVNSLRKVNDQAAGGNNQLSYGKKKKRLIDRSMMQVRTFVLVGSLVAAVVAYCGSLVYASYFKSHKLETAIPFSFLEKQRTLSYIGSLTALFLTSINSSISVDSKKIGVLARDYIQRAYTTDSALTMVSISNQQYYAHRSDVDIYRQVYDLANSPGGVCNFATNTTKCKAAVGVFYDQASYLSNVGL